MTIIKISRDYLITQDEDSLTIDIPEVINLPVEKNYEKIVQAKGILKDKKEAILTHLKQLREEWGHDEISL
jgi:hypothetical protein